MASKYLICLGFIEYFDNLKKLFVTIYISGIH